MLHRLQTQISLLRRTPQVERKIIFVISAPRSGSTWLKQALNAHPQILCTENRFFGRYFDVVQDAGRARPRLRITLDEYVESFLQHFDWQQLRVHKEVVRSQLTTAFVESIMDVSEALSGKEIIVDKITPYLNTSDEVVAAIQKYFPEAALIHLMRDGRDVLTSGVFHWLTKTQDGATLDEIAGKRKAFFVDNRRDIRVDRFFSDADILEWSETWSQPLRAVDKFRPGHKLLRIFYEEMKQDLTAVLARVFAHLGVASSPDLLANCVKNSTFEKMSGGRKAGQSLPTAHVRKGVVGDWKNYFTKQDGELFQRLAGEQLIRMGYEPGPAWVQDLPATLSLQASFGEVPG